MPPARLTTRSRAALTGVALAALVGVGSCTPLDSASDGSAGPEAVVIRDVVVRSMAGDLPSPDEPRDVFIAEGRIIAIEEPGTREIPSGVRTVDGSGRYLIPGLTDMHVHVGDARVLVPFVAHGVTTVRNMWGFPRDLETREAVEAGEMIGPRIITAGPLTDGDPPVWAESETAVTPDEVRRIMEEQQAAGYDFFKVYSRLSPEVFAAALAYGREIGFPVAGHVPDGVEVLDAMRDGMASIEHFTRWGAYLRADDSPFPEYGDGEDPMVVQKRGAAVALRVARGELTIDDLQSEAKRGELAEVAARTGTAQVPTLVTSYYLDQPRSVQRAVLEREGMRYLDPTFATTWDPDFDFRNDGLTEEERVAYGALFEGRLRSVKALHDAGAPVLIGTDTPNPYVMPGYSVHEELAFFVQAGLTPRAALIAATRGPAEFFGEASEWGTIEVGKRADAVLLRSDPLKDIGATLQIDGVLLAGRFLDREALDAELEETAAAWRPPSDFFADAPEPDGVEWSTRYRIEFGGEEFGATRTGTLASGDFSHISQLAFSLDGGVSLFTARFALDAAGRPVRVELVGPLGSPQELTRSLELKEGVAHATLGDTSDQFGSELDAVAAALSPGMVEAMIPVLRSRDGQTVRLGFIDTLGDDAEVEEAEVSRDGAGTLAVAFAQQAADTPTTWTLTTDAEGLVRLVIRESFYEVVFHRVDEEGVEGG